MQRRRIRLDVSYDGTGFAGSQIQPDARTVAGTLKTGLESLLKQPVKLDMAGRTDSGVHADRNVAAFDASLPFPAVKLAGILNKRLPEDLFARSSCETAPDFNPRYDALARTYKYSLYHGYYVPVDRRRYTCPIDKPLDRDVAALVLGMFKGRHSFINFCKGVDRRDEAYCDIHQAELRQYGRWEEHLVFKGNRFLRHMICRLAGALLDVAARRVTIAQIAESLDGELSFKPRPAPPRGLTLMEVDYPDKE